MRLRSFDDLSFVILYSPPAPGFRCCSRAWLPERKEWQDRDVLWDRVESCNGLVKGVWICFLNRRDDRDDVGLGRSSTDSP
ncbi:hypothetical protein NPIL_413301 [Nephila pilipes]|uniref:Uncharacterized protein n=1 Tax=Nephila pilipes TaxID=299642 RepID=A0A8X6UEK8_NEPPI|nr:hypothetical protein NPIL_413301 [Nephila pilipes]